MKSARVGALAGHALIMTALVATGLGLTPGAASAGHDPCHAHFGTVPGSNASIIVIGEGGTEPYRTYYIDDRGFRPLDPSDAEDDGSIWVYAESNGWQGLQAGGEQVVFDQVPGVPRIGPTPVIPPDPNRPVLKGGLTLFPNGFGGGTLAENLGWSDPCSEYGGEGQPSEPDSLLV